MQMLSLGADSEEDCLSILDALTADTLGCSVFLAHKDVDTDARLIRYLEDTADVRIAYPTHTHVSVARTLIAVLTFEITMLTHTHMGYAFNMCAFRCYRCSSKRLHLRQVQQRRRMACSQSCVGALEWV